MTIMFIIFSFFKQTNQFNAVRIGHRSFSEPIIFQWCFAELKHRRHDRIFKPTGGENRDSLNLTSVFVFFLVS